MTQALAPACNLLPDPRRVKVGEEEIRQHSARVAVERRVLVGYEVVVELWWHYAICPLKGEETTIDKLTSTNSLEDLRARSCPLYRGLGKQTTTEAVDPYVGVRFCPID